MVLPPLRARERGAPILRLERRLLDRRGAVHDRDDAACELLGGDAAGRVRLLASDLSTKALARAGAGVYTAERVDGRAARHAAPKYFEKGLGAQAGHGPRRAERSGAWSSSAS